MKLQSVCHFLFGVLLLGALACGAAAQSLIGDEIDAIWIYPPSFNEPHQFTVAPGVDLFGTWGINHNLDVEALSISINFLDGTSGLASDIVWSFLNLDFGGPSVLVSADVTSNYADPSDYILTTTEHSVILEFINSVNLDGTNDVFTINLNPSIIPEPATACQIGLLSIALLAARKRR